MTVQPTEQCVQTFLRIVTVAPGGGGGPASALRTLPPPGVPSAARPPAVRPERRRKLRRSMPPGWAPIPTDRAPPRAARSALLISTSASPGRIAVDSVKGLDLF